MNIQEGKGYVLRSGMDTPLAGWIAASQLEAVGSLRASPWLAVKLICSILDALPGGLDLLWDLPAAQLSGSIQESPASILDLLGHLPGLRLHFRDAALAEHIIAPRNAWIHSRQAPLGAPGHSWRHGWIGWIPETDELAWSLPSVGGLKGENDDSTQSQPVGCIWGELVLPVAALPHLAAEDLAAVLSEAQADIERALSQRMSAGAWPAVFPFHRRKAGWRIAVSGGWEYQLSGGSWEESATRFKAMAEEIQSILKTPVHRGVCNDFVSASLLGHQAMRDGLPWRYSLPMPPASPSFSPGLAADPRLAVALEARTAFPTAMAAVLDAPPRSDLRVPAIPQESGVAAFLQSLQARPAIRWLPPEVPPPGPFMAERPWAQVHSYPPVLDVTQALQPSLFENLE